MIVRYACVGFSDADAAFVDAVLNDARDGWPSRGVYLCAVPPRDAVVVLRRAADADMDARFGAHPHLAGLSRSTPATVYVRASNWARVPPLSDYRTLDAYRAALVRHETGHALGLPHAVCPRAGAPAPTMMQPSLPLQRCVPSPALALSDAEARTLRAPTRQR
jgi:hypothetical protein